MKKQGAKLSYTAMGILILGSCERSVRSFIQQIFVDHLPCNRHCSRDWRYRSEQNRQQSVLWSLCSSRERQTKVSQ